jgi:DNA-binding NarL/FixJ family response regulator
MRTQPPITVALTRFEDLVDRGLRALLSDDAHVEIVAASVDAPALDGVLAALSPRVAILSLASLRGPADVHRLHSAHPETRFVVLADRPSQADCNQMLAFGATACLSKETQGRDILNTIHLASRGMHVLPRVGEHGAVGAPAPARPDLLTPREADVLEHLRDGRSNAEIAIALHVSVETVRTHRRNIYRKLGVRTRRELAAIIAR